MKAVLIPLFFIFLAGCATSSYRNQAEDFRESGGEEAAAYGTLAPVSVEALEYFLAEQYGAVDAFLEGVEERLHDSLELQRYIRDAREINERARLDTDPDWVDFIRRIRSDDELYLFEYRREYYNDFGLLVLRDGRIVFRTVWDSAWPSGMDAQQIANPEIDRL